MARPRQVTYSRARERAAILLLAGVLLFSWSRERALLAQVEAAAAPRTTAASAAPEQQKSLLAYVAAKIMPPAPTLVPTAVPTAVPTSVPTSVPRPVPTRAPVVAARPPEPILVRQATDLAGERWADFPCPETEMYDCACQIACPTKDDCSGALALCNKHRHTLGCAVVSQSGKWASLKRKLTPAEHALIDFDGKAASPADAARVAATARPVAGGTIGSHLLAGDPTALPRLRAHATAALSPGGQGGDGLCGAPAKVEDLAERSIGMVALSYDSPATLHNSMRSWNRSGVLGLMNERILVANRPTPSESIDGFENGFKVVLPDGPELQVPPGRRAAPDLITIGSAFYYGLRMAASDYVLFMEKDFAADPELDLDTFRDELLAASHLLDRGAAVVRLRSRTEQGCGSFRACRRTFPVWRRRSTKEGKRNWWSFYCDEHARSTPPGRVADCLGGRNPDLDGGGANGTAPAPGRRRKPPRFRCFSALDSNWTLNAVLVKKSFMFAHVGGFPRGNGTSIAAYGEDSSWNRQDGFESGMIQDNWGKFGFKVCISFEGLFVHQEIDG